MTNESPTIADSLADAAPTSEEVVAPAPAPVKWLARNNYGQTNFDRYVAPLLIPLTAVAVIVFFVVNLSRALLAGSHTISLIVASVVTIAILVAATALSAATNMRSHTITIFSCVGLLMVIGIGWISVGHAQEAKEEAAVACEPVTGELVVATTTALKFDPEYTAEVGCVNILLTGPPSLHNLTFVGEKKPKGPVLLSSAPGKDEFAFTLEAGEYEIKCTVAGHEAMVAALVVK